MMPKKENDNPKYLNCQFRNPNLQSATMTYTACKLIGKGPHGEVYKGKKQ